jgi:flagellar biosynthesis chaperone FliJ
LVTTKFQVQELETKLKASTQDLEEAQAQISNLEGKQKKIVEAIVKAAKKAVVEEYAQTTQAEEKLAKTLADQASREEEVQHA